MNAVENYARGQGIKNIRLSALPYVIHYYRKLGYRHIRPGQGIEDEEATITGLADQVGTKRYKDDIEIENAHKIEMALAFLSLGSSDERREAEIRNLNAYFPDFFFGRDREDPSKVYVEPRTYARRDLDSRYKGDREAQEELRSLEDMVNAKLLEKAKTPGHTETAHELRRFFEVLVKRGFALDCEAGLSRRLLMELVVDEEGKAAELACDSNGYTMRKTLATGKRILPCDEKKGGGWKKSLKRRYRMSRYTRRRSHRRRSHRKCPRGTARKIVGQRRRWSGGVDRLVKHGHLSRKCYRKRNTRRRRR
jgi:hypothetical protein